MNAELINEYIELNKFTNKENSNFQEGFIERFNIKPTTKTQNQITTDTTTNGGSSICNTTSSSASDTESDDDIDITVKDSPLDVIV